MHATDCRRRGLAGQRAAAGPSGGGYTDSIDAGNSLAGNYLSAVVAGASRDTGAAAFFYREALRDDPRNADLIERAFVSLLADGAIRRPCSSPSG